MGMQSGMGTVQFLSNDDLDQQDDAKKMAERDITVAPSTLASFVREFFNSAKRAKLDIEREMLKLIRQSKGEYEAEMMAALKEAGMPEDFFRLTSRKERDVEGWLWDVFNSMGERSWDIVPDQTPELPPDLEAGIEEHVKQGIMQHPEVQALMLQAQQTGQPIDIRAVKDIARREAGDMKDEAVSQARQYAEERCTAMERTIQDQLDLGGYYEALKACINDLSRLQSCIMKGPILKRKKVLGDWQQDPATGKWKPIVESQIVPCFERVSPFDWYPVANSNSVHDGAACELEHFNDPADLQKLVGVPGYKDDVIVQILKDHPNGHRETTPIAPERFLLEKDNSTGLYDNKGLDSINYWGEISGKLLKEWDIKDVAEDEFYFCNIKMINSQVYRAVINPDPLGRKPYHVTSFIKSNDSQWGIAPGQLAYDIQGFCNNVIRNLSRNISESAGPMADVNEDRLAEGETPDRWPGKTFVTTSKGMQTGDAVKYYQASLLAGELWSLFQNAKLELDSIIIPSFGQGSSLTKGGGRTASGLAMIANAESRNLKVSVWNVDSDIQTPCIERLFIHNMLFTDDDSIKGALRVKARGVAAQLVKENMAARQGEFMTRAMNPLISRLIGDKGLAYLIRKDAENLSLDVNQVIPNYEQIEASAPQQITQDPAAAQAGGATAAQTPAPANTDVAGVPVAQYQE